MIYGVYCLLYILWPRLLAFEQIANRWDPVALLRLSDVSPVVHQLGNEQLILLVLLHHAHWTHLGVACPTTPTGWLLHGLRKMVGSNRAVQIVVQVKHVGSAIEVSHFQIFEFLINCSLLII